MQDDASALSGLEAFFAPASSPDEEDGPWRELFKGEYNAFKEAIKASRDLSTETLVDIACRVRYLDYMHTLSRVEFENCLAVCLSDLFEDMDEDALQRWVRREAVGRVRQRPEYQAMLQRIRQEMQGIQSLEGETSADWVRRRARDARNAIERQMLRGKSAKDILKAASEVLERDMPKASRSASGPAVVLFREEDAVLVERAMKVIAPESATKDGGELAPARKKPGRKAQALPAAAGDDGILDIDIEAFAEKARGESGGRGEAEG